MKNQALFSLKDISKKLKSRLLQFLFGALRFNIRLLTAIGLNLSWDIIVTETHVLHAEGQDLLFFFSL